MRRLVDRVFTAPPTFPWPREERNGATFPIEPGDSRNGLASVCLTGSFFAVFPPISSGLAHYPCRRHQRSVLCRQLHAEAQDGLEGLTGPPSRATGNAPGRIRNARDKRRQAAVMESGGTR